MCWVLTLSSRAPQATMSRQKQHDLHADGKAAPDDDDEAPVSEVRR